MQTPVLSAAERLGVAHVVSSLHSVHRITRSHH
jgi:hypothetical protein